jgi:N utilization substance protein B
MTNQRHDETDQGSALGTQHSALEEEWPADPRRRARWLAVMALYEWDQTGHDPLTALAHRLEDRPDKPSVAGQASALVAGVQEHAVAIGDALARAAPGWSMEQMAAVDRNILRVATYELLFASRTPVRAAVNEAVELAKTFGGEGSPRFVNGVLGAVAAMTDREGGRER